MPNLPQVEDVKDFARTHPLVASGLLLIPVIYTLTGDIGMTLFAGGMIAFGPTIADGIKNAQQNKDDRNEQTLGDLLDD